MDINTLKIKSFLRMGNWIIIKFYDKKIWCYTLIN